MLKISNKHLTIVFKDTKEGDIPHSKANVLLAKKELGFSANISLMDGLKKLL
jgi:UDP-glucose 4-epimerase